MADNPSERSASLRVAVYLGVAIAAVGIASALDRPFAEYVARHPSGYSEMNTLLRMAGYVPLWTIVAIAFAMIDARLGWRGVWSRGGLLFASVVVSGGAAEVLKMLVRRQRPTPPFAEYLFRPWPQDTFSSAGLGWPSSHVAVAFAAVWVLCRVHPRASLVWILIGGGCAVSRVAHNGHYLSDVVGAAALSYGVVLALSSVSARSR